ncbi:YlxR family protein [Candidatus Magnetomonas plexicatena]|nr:YlxR family protein [Nitrospirales bacterium LBB_01]
MPEHPQRTCVSCRAKKGRAELLRLVVENGRLVYDRGKVLSGRGYHVCREKQCIDVLMRGKRLKKIFKVDVEVGSLEHLKELLISEEIT